jgi:hypothetical protein
MLQTAQPETLQVIGALKQIRQEWQEAANGTSLLEIEGNVGMMLADMINYLHLPTEVQMKVLGNELFSELQEFLGTTTKK